MKKIISIIGARPQFIKHAPMQLQLQKYFNALTLHTGQHYDNNMSDIFFDELNIPKPDFLLKINGGSSQGMQTGCMMIEIEKIFEKESPDLVLIYGDTNSTLAATLVAVKMNIKLIHIEAGLRSFNRIMPEEVNRIIADEFSDLLFCPTNDAVANLKREGIIGDVFVSGDVMCDMLRIVEDKYLRQIEEPYYFATLHRPYNTDEKERLTYILDELNGLDKIVIFPMHPRTVARMVTFDIAPDKYENILIISPTSYIESISYQKFADCVITDSGGMQKEAYMLKRKCITVRSETEWSETLQNGWNTLVFDDLSNLQNIINELPGDYVDFMYGDGHAAERITKIIRDFFQ